MVKNRQYGSPLGAYRTMVGRRVMLTLAELKPAMAVMMEAAGRGRVCGVGLGWGYRRREGAGN